MKWIELVIAGNIPPETIDDYIAEWHNKSEHSMPLFEFLGITKAEYKQWAENPESLTNIIQERQKACTQKAK